MVCGYKFWAPMGNSKFWPSLVYTNTDTFKELKNPILIPTRKFYCLWKFLCVSQQISFFDVKSAKTHRYTSSLAFATIKRSLWTACCCHASEISPYFSSPCSPTLNSATWKSSSAGPTSSCSSTPSRTWPPSIWCGNSQSWWGTDCYTYPMHWIWRTFFKLQIRPRPVQKRTCSVKGSPPSPLGLGLRVEANKTGFEVMETNLSSFLCLIRLTHPRAPVAATWQNWAIFFYEIMQNRVRQKQFCRVRLLCLTTYESSWILIRGRPH